jgi:DNA helicase II / ATP-dependent DNA helicase PcrA
LLDPAAVLRGLDPEQRGVAEALRGPVRVLAGAGTGKTRAITHRIAYGVATGVYNPTSVLAVTFTTRAAGEMRGRLRRLEVDGVQARTFHSAALRQLRYFWPHVHGTELPTLTESKLGMLATAASRQRVHPDRATLRDVAAEVEWAKVSNVSPDDYSRIALRRGRSVNGLDAETVGRLFGSYEDVKRSQARMDMEDVLLLTAGMLADDERVAAQVRRQYKWFVVDEFQDVSPLQSALLDLWLGGREEICVVGDPAQTIYSFAGADARYLRDFPTKYPDATMIDLVRNYRSSAGVVAAANDLLAGTASAGVRLVAQVADQRPSAAVSYTPYPDEIAEADAVAAAVRRLRDAGTPPGEVAVLFRINAQSEAYEEALAALGIPYVVRGAARFFDRAEVREAVTRLRGAARGDTGVPEGDPDHRLVEAVRAVLSVMGWTPDAPAARGQTRDRWESLQALVDQAAELAATGATELAAFVEDLDRRAAEQHAPVAGGVTLATLHAAKGLEWDAVFVVGVCEGTLPITYAESPTAIEEERRLLYVGVTRARRTLAVSWAWSRNPGGRATRQPSRFLDPLLPAAARTHPATSRSRKVISCRECGRPLATSAEKKRGRCSDCPASYDEELFEQLRTWRSGQAAEESVPAYVVFTDATLQLIAEHKPRSADALLRINGIGKAKLDRYGDAVLTLVGGLAGALPLAGPASPEEIELVGKTPRK